MSTVWTAKETTSHQDHVIAHVLGAAIRGYFVFDEALHLLLDIGFIWTLFLDGQMNLLPHPVAVIELELDQPGRDEIKADIDILLGENPDKKTARMKPLDKGEIKEVSYFNSGDRDRFLLECEHGNLSIETAITTTEFQIYEC